MANDLPTPAGPTPHRGLGVMDLIRTAETLKRAGAGGAVSALYDTWIQANPDDPLLHAVLFNHAVTLSDEGDLPRARECLERAIARAPDFMPAHINLGRILERQGAVGAAVTQWSQVVEKLAGVTGTTISHKTTALNQIARTLETAGRDETAEEMLRQSLDIDPHQREVAQHYTAPASAHLRVAGDRAVGAGEPAPADDRPVAALRRRLHRRSAVPTGARRSLQRRRHRPARRRDGGVAEGGDPFGGRSGSAISRRICANTRSGT